MSATETSAYRENTWAAVTGHLDEVTAADVFIATVRAGRPWPTWSRSC